MFIDSIRFITDPLKSDPTIPEFDVFVGELFSKKNSKFEECYGSTFRDATERARNAAKRNNLKYFCTYLHFQPSINYEHTSFYDVKDFMREYIDFDLHSMNFSPVLKETESFYSGGEEVSYHAFILEADITTGRERKAYRYCLPKVNEKRLEVLARYCEIHMHNNGRKEPLTSGYWNDYVVSQFEQMNLYGEADLVSKLR